MLQNTRKNHQIQQKLLENEEKLAIFTLILMAAFGTKNVHSAVVTQPKIQLLISIICQLGDIATASQEDTSGDFPRPDKMTHNFKNIDQSASRISRRAS